MLQNFPNKINEAIIFDFKLNFSSIDGPFQLIIIISFKRMPSLSKRIDYNPERPYISLFTNILFSTDDFRCHIIGRAADHS